MQRLMQMLRNSQGSCTTNECLTDGAPGLAGGSDAMGAESQFTMWTMVIGWVLLAVVLYFMRSPSRRSNAVEKQAPGNGGGRGGGNGGGNDPAPVF